MYHGLGTDNLSIITQIWLNINRVAVATQCWLWHYHQHHHHHHHLLQSGSRHHVAWLSCHLLRSLPRGLAASQQSSKVNLGTWVGPVSQ